MRAMVKVPLHHAEPGPGAARPAGSVPGRAGRRAGRVAADGDLHRERPLPALAAAGVHDRTVLRSDGGQDVRPGRRGGGGPMKPFIAPRLRKPAVSALTGVLFAVAWLVHGGSLWWISILAVIVGGARALSLYQIGGQDTDEGALAGSRADERQQLVGLRSRSLACNFAV